jgi:surface polysaccharide O-acyltransferase-like enzyme
MFSELGHNGLPCSPFFICSLFVLWGQTGVPLFLLISGYLFLGADKSPLTYTWLRQKILKIALPSLLWAIFYSLLFKVNISKDLLFLNFNGLLYGPAYHLYYIAVIIPWYFLGFYIKNALKYWYVSVVLLFTILLTSKNELIFNSYLIFIPYGIYFLLGYLLYKYQKIFKATSLLRVCIFLVTSVIGAFIVGKEVNIQGHWGVDELLYFSPLVMIISILLFLSVESLAKNYHSSIITQLSKNTFSIYFIHLFIIKISQPIFNLFSFLGYPQVLIASVITWIFSYLLADILKKALATKKVKQKNSRFS